MYKGKTYLLFLLLILTGSLSALKNTDYVYRNFTVEDGLSQSSVQAMLHDSKGYLWIGTADGLNRYDGYEFKIYRNEVKDTLSISDNGISALYEDKKGIVWIGTVAGALNYYDRKTGAFHHFDISEGIQTPNTSCPSYLELNLNYMRKGKKTITTITEDNYGNIWAGTWDNGIFVLNPTGSLILHFYKSGNSNYPLTDNQISKILFDGKNTFWIGTFGGGVNRLTLDQNIFSLVKTEADISKLKFEPVKEFPAPGRGLFACFVTSLFMDKNKTIWIGTYGSGIYTINSLDRNSLLSAKQYGEYLNEYPDFSKLIILDICSDNQGNILAGTFGFGVCIIGADGKETCFLKNDPHNINSLSTNEVASIYTDRLGIIWAGASMANGLCKIMRSNFKFNHITSSPENKNSLNNRTVFSIYEDKDKNLWIGTYSGGVNRIDGKTRQVKIYTKDEKNVNSLGDKHIRAITGDPFGNIWFGTFNGGLNRLDTKTNRIYRYQYSKTNPDGIGANQIQSLFIDSSQVLWIGTFGGGINCLDLKSFDPVNPKFTAYKNSTIDHSSLSDNRVYSIMEDRGKTFWIGTYGGGLNRLDRRTNRFIVYRNDPSDDFSISSDRVMSVFEDTDRRLWIGTYGGGLNYFDRKSGKFKRYNDRNGLLSNVVYGIVEDENKNLWLSTDNGIFKFEISSETFVHYDIQDGLQSREFNGGAYFKNSEGEIFFGGINGINYFIPKNVKKNTSVPPIVINKFKIFDNEWKGEIKEICLSYNQNFISFEFSALDFTNPSGNKYAYMLENFDKDWRYTDAKYRIANYTNLPYGKYTFRVKGTNNDGVWNNEGTSVVLIIYPPFWLSWWFIGLCLVAVSIPALMVIKFRLDKIKSIEKLKTKLAADIHDNIGAGLTEISILSELVSNNISKEPDNARTKLQYIGHTARKLVDDLSDIVWVINPNQDSLYDLIIRLKNSYNEIFSYMGISFKTDNIEKLAEMKLSMDYRQNLYLIFKEGINNCIKHSKCKKIALQVNIKGNVIQMSLKDDGQGLIEKSGRKGNGLVNIKTRAKIIGGKVYWHSVPNEGTTVNFIGRVDKKAGWKSILRNALNPLLTYSK